MGVPLDPLKPSTLNPKLLGSWRDSKVWSCRVLGFQILQVVENKPYKNLAITLSLSTPTQIDF